MPKVFINHSSKDSILVKDFVTFLQRGMQLTNSDIFCITEEFQIDVTGITTLKIELSDNTSTKGGTAFGLANLAL